MNALSPRAFYESYQRNSVDGTMDRLCLMADWFRQRGYYGLIFFHPPVLRGQGKQTPGIPVFRHVFRLYHPKMKVQKGWVRRVEKEVGVMVSELIPDTEIGPSTTHWSPNRFNIPIAPTQHILPSWCDISCALPAGGKAPDEKVYVLVKDWMQR